MALVQIYLAVLSTNAHVRIHALFDVPVSSEYSTNQICHISCNFPFKPVTVNIEVVDGPKTMVNIKMVGHFWEIIIVQIIVSNTSLIIRPHCTHKNKVLTDRYMHKLHIL